MHRRATFGTVLLAVSATLTGCVPLAPGADPRFATDSGAAPQGQPVTTPPEASGPPAIEAPKSDLPWRDCTAQMFTDAAVPAAPGVRLECASYDADTNPLSGDSSKVSIGVLRARSVQTPADAGPVVFTTGWDRPSSLQLPVWLSRAGADVLRSHPIVAVDRRGTGTSDAVSCRDRRQRQVMWEQAQFERGDDPVAKLGDVATTATTDCTDVISPGESAYDNAHAAADLEELRSTWNVSTLALIGVGNGAQVALAYAGAYPDKLARLALDSPIAPGVGAETAAESRVRGQQAAFEAFVAQCVAVGCALGGDPRGAVDALLASARSDNGPGRASVAALTYAIINALGYPNGDGVKNTTGLANALAAARTGDTNPLTNLINQAQATLGNDGRFINSCADALDRPTPDRVRELVVSWGKQYPEFGTVGALDLVKCLSWPSSSVPAAPEDLKINVMLLGVQNDAIVGGDGVQASVATIVNASTTGRRVMWQGVGHGAAIYSSCAVPPLIGYLDEGTLPDNDTYCPA